jgi:hypothetical protein
MNYVGGKPVYANGYLRRTSGNTVEIKITELKVGAISMSPEIISRTEYEVGIIVNGLFAPNHGFNIQELRIENGQMYYKGTVPSEISSN